MYTLTVRDEAVYRKFMDRVAQEGSSVDDVLREMLDIEPKTVNAKVATTYTLTLRDETVYRKFIDRVAQSGSSVDDVLRDLIDRVND